MQSFVEFLYADELIQWTTGDSAGGVNGTGGIAAQAGISAGDGITSVTIPGSRTPAIINIDQTSNVEIPGVWVFQVDSSDINGSGLSDFICRFSFQFQTFNIHL